MIISKLFEMLGTKCSQQFEIIAKERIEKNTHNEKYIIKNIHL